MWVCGRDVSRPFLYPSPHHCRAGVGTGTLHQPRPPVPRVGVGTDPYIRRSARPRGVRKRPYGDTVVWPKMVADTTVGVSSKEGGPDMSGPYI